jgi:outer membrane protein OmpA-like peptidoglycan-associated protein
MSHRLLSVAAIALGALLPAALQAQQVEQSKPIVAGDVASQVSAFSYREGPKSKLLLRGSPLTAGAEGKATVEFQKGRSEVEAKVEKLPDPATLGPYTTYVLWAVAPDGRATNLGVLETERGSGKLKTSYSGSQFAMIVTAEPHFAVTAPSTALVLINVADNVKGEETKVTSLAERADYSGLQSIAINPKTAPAELVAAKYSVAIAAASGAKQYAAESYTSAENKLHDAELAQASKKSAERKVAPRLAREAAQAGEDARRAGMAASSAAAAAAATAAEAQKAERARSEEIAAEQARNELRDRLSRVLPTRETDRGLVSEIGGVQFPSGTANLTAGGRESLAKFGGVVTSYPGLRFNVEGHTDNTGSEAKNQELSLKRAISVRDYLIGQGVAASTIDVAGLGSSKPITDNSTAQGRASNRRVEIVVSGGPLAEK